MGKWNLWPLPSLVSSEPIHIVDLLVCCSTGINSMDHHMYYRLVSMMFLHFFFSMYIIGMLLLYFPSN
uniref:Uncharacterized protein n=1 Tax=Arundo donax TaxID=35708 RepID=A0A0A9F8G2_ARUDO